MQRLFSAFPNSWPGGALLLQRVVIAVFLFWFEFGPHTEVRPFALSLPHLIAAGAGIFLLFGLWTPVCGAIIAIVELWIAFLGDSGISIMLATLGGTLAMIGPGAWSLDARIFGRRHYEMKPQ